MPSLYFAFSFGLAKGFQLLLVLIFAWVLSPERFGVFDISLTFIAFANILISCSLESAIARFWFQKDLEDRRALLFSTAASFQLILSIVTTLLVVMSYSLWLDLFDSSIKNESYFLTAIILFTLLSGPLAVGNLALMVLRLEASYKAYSVQNLMLYLSNFLLPLVFYVISEQLLISLALGMFISALIFVTIGCYFCWHYIQKRFSFGLLFSSLGFSIPLVPAVFLDWINQQIDRFFLLFLLGIAAVAQYGFVARFAAILYLLVQLFQLLWLAKAMAKIEGDDFKDFFRASLNLYIAVTFFAVTIITLFLPTIMEVIYEDKYGDISLLLTVLIIAISIHGASNIVNVGTIKKKETYWNAPVILGTSLLNGIISYYCILFFGLWGAAFGTLIAYLIMITSYAVLSYYKVGMIFDWIPILLFFLGALFLLFYRYFADYFSPFTQILVISILLGGAIIFLYKQVADHFDAIIS